MPRLRLGLTLAGLALAVLAIARDDKRISWAAIVVLVAVLALRIAERVRARRASRSE